MIKIMKHGNVNRKFKHTCYVCRCKFSFTVDDLSDKCSIGNNAMIYCPECGIINAIPEIAYEAVTCRKAMRGGD